MPLLKDSFKRAVPWPVRRFLRHLAADAASVPARLRGETLPWRLLHDSGGGDFETIGRLMFDEVVAATAADPKSAVLEIGCGDGRLARRAAAWLAADGSYVGFDISRSAIAFCRRTIGPLRADFDFVFADLANGEYNSRGKETAAAYRFPCADASRDLVYATSVFTHLMPADAAQYFREIARVLKPGAVAYVTFFLVDAEARRALDAGRSPYVLHRRNDGLWSTDPAAPEAGVGYEEATVLAMIDDAALRVHARRRGSWSGAKAAHFQDALVLAHR